MKILFQDIKMPECEQCGNKIRSNKIIRHINVRQDTREHLFCSDNCKVNWCYEKGVKYE